MARLLIQYVALASIAGTTLATTWPTWCGKNYEEGSPIVPPGGEFPVPATSTSPLLAFRCAPAIKPYVESDALSTAGILIDTYITYSEIAGAAPINLPESDSWLASLDDGLIVSVVVDGVQLTTGVVPLNATKVELPFSLLELAPQKSTYDVTCSALYVSDAGIQTFEASTSLAYLPDLTDGSAVVKMDGRTGALLAKPANGKGGDYQTVFPVGFYTSFSDYLALNLSIIDAAKEQGYTIIHPIPTYDNTTALLEVIARMEEVGMYFVYDMRGTYMNDTSVIEQVNMVKNSSALLIWYTGDEPDGSEAALNATQIAYDLIYELDGYHPVSLVLNCFDYYWNNYSAGADIVLQDTYMIGNNATWSVEWDTICTPEYGDCGCDDCKGNFEDISTRMDEFAYRLWVNGQERTKALWTVPQGFGEEEYWPRYPTGQEFVVQSVVAINHGGLGVTSWDAPTTDDIAAAAALLGQASSTFKEYILSPIASFSHVFSNQIDIGLWTVSGKTLVLATNLNYANETFDLASVKGLTTDVVTEVFNMGATFEGSSIAFSSVGTGGWVFE